MPRPTPRTLMLAAAGLALAVLPALGVPAGAEVWLAVILLLLAAVVADAAAAPRAGRLELEVEVPPVLPVDGTGEAVVRLRLPARRPLPTEVLVELSENLEPAPTRHTAVGGDREGEAVFPLVPRRRGEAAVEEVWVRWRGPLGLVRRVARRRSSATVVVTPDLGRVRRRALERLSQRDAPVGRKIERYAGEGSEFHALREWTTGLDRRDIDWKASARHTRLLTREVRAERNHRIVLAVDTGRLMAEPLAGVPRLDHAIHAALLLAAVSLRSGDRVGLYAFDDRPRAFLPPRGGRAALPGVVEQAASLEYSAAETAFTLALTELSRRLRRRSLVVVLTDFVDSITAELMVDNLQRLARRQLVLFVALRDPLLVELTAAEPRHRADLDRAAVAATLLRERREVLGRLALSGVQTVDAAPHEVGPALVDRYLEIKRRERI